MKLEITEESWERLHESGLLGWVNRLLRLWGWSINFDADGRFYPVRVTLRCEDSSTASWMTCLREGEAKFLTALTELMASVERYNPDDVRALFDGWTLEDEE